MGTRSNIIVADDHSRIQLYRHWDGYPDGEGGVLADLALALPYAWPLPRFEADDFAAALIRAWKGEGGGNIYIDGSPKGWERIHDDVEWVYVIQRRERQQPARLPECPGEPEVAVYDWHHYWFDKADPEKNQPKPTFAGAVVFRPRSGAAMARCLEARSLAPFRLGASIDRGSWEPGRSWPC